MGIDDIDLTEDHIFGHGFDPAVCQGCPHLDESGYLDTCSLCGCPVGNLSNEEAPPVSCIRLDQHEDPNVEKGDGGVMETIDGVADSLSDFLE